MMMIVLRLEFEIIQIPDKLTPHDLQNFFLINFQLSSININ